jgi:hypothetical protein
MAGWNDLPNELREMVVGMLDDGEYLWHGSGHPSEEFRALLALSATDRELHALVSPLVWKVSS